MKGNGFIIVFHGWLYDWHHDWLYDWLHDCLHDCPHEEQQSTMTTGTIALNKKAKFHYILHERFEAGIALEGWEVKSLRAGRGQLTDTYVLLQNGEAYLLGSNIAPLAAASKHSETNPQRIRKLLLHKKEIARLIGATQRKGQTCVPLALYWKANRVKCEIALATGKKDQDKRAAAKEKDWKRQQSRLMKEYNR